MSGRARVPLGASKRTEMFGPASGRTTPSSEEDFLSANKDVPRAVSRQQQPQQQQTGAGGASATPYGALSPGRRRPFSSPYNGNPVAPGRAEYGPTSQSGREGGTPTGNEGAQESPRGEVSRSKNATGGDNGAHHGDEDMLELEHIIG
ncbi:unnamed protein product [Pylaiella littoralis]